MKNRLKELRQERHLTLKQLGQEINMRDNTLSQYETGKRNPKFEIWKKLADYFGVSVSFLQGLDKQSTEEQKNCQMYGEKGRDRKMTLKVLLTDGSMVTVENMTADDFRNLIAQHNWIPLDSMELNLYSAGHGYINTNNITTFVEQRG